ncbi:hypothetical protein Tco_0829377 [Tanacetum coccineum]
MENQEQNPPQQEQPFVAAKQVSLNLEDILLNTNNEVLKLNQPEEPPFTDDMLAIYTTTKPMVFKAPKTSSNAERVPQGTTLGAKLGYNKLLTSLKQPLVSSSEATKAIGGPTSLGVTNKERANPDLSSGMLAFNLNEPIFSSSFIIHSESASGNDASAVSIAKVDPGKSAPSTDPHVLVDKTRSVSKGLETILTQPIIGKGASSISRQVKEDEASRTIKLEDLAKLLSSVQTSFKDLDSLKDDPIIVVDESDEDEEANKVHATTNVETEDTSVPKSSSPSSLPTELKELPSKFNELTEEVKGLKKQVHNLKIELSGELKEISTKLEDFTKTVTTQVEVIQANLKILDALLSLLHKLTNALNQFAQAIASKITKDNSVPSTGQARTQPAEEEKNTIQATISYSSQPEGEHIKKNKGKKALSLEKVEKVSTNSDSDDDETYVTGSMVESFRIKKVNKFDFVTEDGKHIHLTKEQINQQKMIEEEAKAKAAKHESKVRKEELVDLFSPEVVKKYYNDKLQYDCRILEIITQSND